MAQNALCIAETAGRLEVELAQTVADEELSRVALAAKCSDAAHEIILQLAQLEEQQARIPILVAALSRLRQLVRVSYDLPRQVAMEALDRKSHEDCETARYACALLQTVFLAHDILISSVPVTAQLQLFI